MHHPFYLNTQHAVTYRQRSQTMQPIRGRDLPDNNWRNMLVSLDKPADDQVQDKVNYANISIYDHRSSNKNLEYDKGQLNVLKTTNYQHPQVEAQSKRTSNYHYRNLSINNHQQVGVNYHDRSHSQSQNQYYEAMSQQMNDPNNYYNVSNIGANRCIDVPFKNLEQFQSNIQKLNKINGRINGQERSKPGAGTRLDSITLMQLCNQFSSLDSAPTTPPPRCYTISEAQNGLLYKAKIPQNRYTKGPF